MQSCDHLIYLTPFNLIQAGQFPAVDDTAKYSPVLRGRAPFMRAPLVDSCTIYDALLAEHGYSRMIRVCPCTWLYNSTIISCVHTIRRFCDIRAPTSPYRHNRSASLFGKVAYDLQGPLAPEASPEL